MERISALGRAVGAAIAGLLASGCTSGGAPDIGALSPTRLWLRASQEPQPVTVAQLRQALADRLGAKPGDAQVTADLKTLTGRTVVQFARARVDTDCTHFLNRLRAAQAGSRFTSIGISATNALTLGIMGAASAAAPAVAIVGASIAAANTLHNGFDETVLMTQYADQIARLVADEQVRVRAGWLTETRLDETGIEAQELGLALGAEYARTCNYSGIRRLLDQAITAGTVSLAKAADRDAAEQQRLAATLSALRRVLGRPVSVDEAAQLQLVIEQRTMPGTPGPLASAFAGLPPADKAEVTTLLRRATESPEFQRSLAAQRRPAG